MGMSRYQTHRSHYDRRHGPAVDAAGDGLEGSYTAILNSTPANSAVKIIIPALGLTYQRTANCPSSFEGAQGDRVLITFDEQKNPWVVQTTA